MLCTSSILLLLLLLVIKSMPLKTNTKQKDCMTPKVLTKLGCKTADDYKCLCGQPKDAVKNLVKGCVKSKCGLLKAAKVGKKAHKVCECLGH